ncbi:MAG: hypothetical protein ACK5GX_00070 [Bacteroidota bacterium]|jgi:hypothetical protein
MKYINFNNELKEYYNQKTLPTDVGSFALDGIIDIKKYNESSIKILWILKEAWGTGWLNNQKGRPFEYPEYINTEFNFGESFPSSGAMWAKIIYINYGILNGFLKWDHMPNYWESEDVFNSLKNCALINLKKIPGSTVSNMNEIYQHYRTDKEVILNQIDIINPDVIICGGTYKILTKEYPFDILKNSNNEYRNGNKKRIFIPTYHPSYYSIGQEAYCDSVVQRCKTYFI